MYSEQLMKCFCEARKSQAYYTKCLSEVSTDEEKNILISLVQGASKASNEIKNYCSIKDPH